MSIQKKTIMGLLILFVMTMLSSAFVPIEVQAAPISTAQQGATFEETEDPMDVGLPSVSTNDINDWTERKGFEVIGVLQKFVQPLAIVIFIGCAILTLIGAFGNGKMVSRGLLGMFISLIMYVVVLYAPEIMDVFLGFVRS